MAILETIFVPPKSITRKQKTKICLPLDCGSLFVTKRFWRRIAEMKIDH